MKKKFKTIMALTAALAVSVSGMCMTSADEDTTPTPSSPMIVEDKDGDGKFDDVSPIPVTLSTTHLLKATIDYGAMKLSYSLKDGKFSTDSFNGENNRLTVTNGSTCPITATVAFKLDETYNDALSECGFQLTSDKAGATKITAPIQLSYEGDTTAGAVSTSDVYLNATKTTGLEAIHGYQLKDAAIGNITVTLESNLTTV